VVINFHRRPRRAQAHPGTLRSSTEKLSTFIAHKVPMACPQAVLARQLAPHQQMASLPLQRLNAAQQNQVLSMYSQQQIAAQQRHQQSGTVPSDARPPPPPAVSQPYVQPGTSAPRFAADARPPPPQAAFSLPAMPQVHPPRWEGWLRTPTVCLYLCASVHLVPCAWQILGRRHCLVLGL
jgi:hypothetical protein